MMIDVLVAEYPGDNAWFRFAALFGDGADGTELGLQDASLARVLKAELGRRAAEWLATPVRALDGLTPLQVLRDHPQGLVAVRSVVMRFPR